MIKCIITTLDNLKILKEQIAILRDEPLDEIIVVNNGSIDGTKEWLDSQSNLTVINHKENNGPSIGRNSGLDKAGKFDYVFMLDGGIRPLRNSIKHMINYLESTPECDVIGVEIPDMTTDYNKAWRRWVEPITNTYTNTRLSHTAYCLARYKAFDEIRFCIDGPFGEAGVMAEDDELMYQWLDKGIVLHVVTGIHPYRNASGSFRRLYEETGIWPNQFGSVYEKRVVWLHQNWPQYEPVGQWGEPWLTVVIKYSDITSTAKMIKYAHDELRKRHFEPPFTNDFNPYHIHVWGNNPKWLNWAKYRKLRQHHGDTILIDKEIIKRNESNKLTWTGDFILNTSDNWKLKIRPNSYYYGLAENMNKLKVLIEEYNHTHPHQPVKNLPNNRGEL